MGFFGSGIVEKLSSQKMGLLVGLVILILVSGGILLFKHDQNRSATVVKSPDVLAADMPGWWYKQYFNSSVCEAASCKPESDPDNDKLTNAQEFYYRSNPVMADTNSNGKNDGQDVALGIDPSKPGDMTFEEAGSEDEIFGESMVYADTIKSEFAKTMNPNNVPIKLADDSQVKIIDNNSNEAKIDYLVAINATVTKYFDSGTAEYVKNVVSSQDPDGIADIQMRSGKIYQDLRKIEVPSSVVSLHKYLLRYFELLGQVVRAPSMEAIQNTYDPTANLWSDNIKEFMVLLDRVKVEQKRLNLPLPEETKQGQEAK